MKIYLVVVFLILALGDNIFQYLPAIFNSDTPIFKSTLVSCYNFGRNVEINKLHKNGKDQFSFNTPKQDVLKGRSNRLRRTKDELPPQNTEPIIFDNEEDMLGVGDRMKTGVMAYVRSLDSFFGKLLGGWSPFTMGNILVKDSPIAEAQTGMEDELEQAATSIEEIQIDMGSGSIKKDDWMDIPTESQSHLISILSTVEPTPTPVTNDVEEPEENVTEGKDIITEILVTTPTTPVSKEDEPVQEENKFESEDKDLVDKVMVSKERKNPAKDDAYKPHTKENGKKLNGIWKESKDIVEDKEPVLEGDDAIQSTSQIIDSKEKRLRLMAINNARTGDLNGIDKINYQCQFEAFEAGLDGLFRAFLASKDLHLHNILSPVDSVERKIVNSEGDTLFKSYQHLISTKGKLNITNIIAPINSFNKKNIIFDEHWPFNLVWTGHEDDESHNGDVKRCNEWTSEDPTLKGVTSDYLFKGLLYTREEPCDDTFIVLCLELGSESYINTFLNEEEYHKELEAYYDAFRTITKF